jgi:hypothetical protein
LRPYAVQHGARLNCRASFMYKLQHKSYIKKWVMIYNPDIITELYKLVHVQNTTQAAKTFASDRKSGQCLQCTVIFGRCEKRAGA